MSTIITRAGKGSPLTNNEVDANFTNLNTDKAELSGAAFTGNITFTDNSKAIFGAGSDLQIYHDGSNSYIKDAGSGFLVVNTGATGFLVQNGSGQNVIQTGGNDVTLRYGASTKLSTTSTGIDVTGTATMDGLTVDGTAIVSDSTASIFRLLNTGTTGDGLIHFGDSASNFSGVIQYNHDADYMALFTATQERLRITSAGIDVTGTATMDGLTTAFLNNDTNILLTVDADNNQTGKSFLVRDGSGKSFLKAEQGGDISFYEDTGTTAKFFWDASAESLGIGTSSPASKLDIVGLNKDAIKIRSDVAPANYYQIGRNQSTGLLEFFGSEVTYNGYLFKGPSSDLMTINASGNVGIGTTSPSVPLDIKSTNSASIKWQRTGVAAKEWGFVSDNDQTYLYNFTDGITSTSFKNNGNVGIGTSPLTKLHVKSTTDNIVAAQVSTASVNALFQSIESAGLAQIGTTGAHAFTLFTANQERMRIDSAGNVGIGSTSASGSRLRLDNGGTSGAPQLMLTATGASTQTEIRHDTSNNLIFENWNSGRTERMRIDSAGNVGIGTSSPFVGIDLRGTSATAGNTIQIVGNSVSTLLLGQDADGGVIRGQGGNNALKFYTGGTGDSAANASGTERMRIDSAGNVGIVSGDISLAAGKFLKYSATSYITPENNVSGAEVSTAGVFSVKTGATPTERMRIDSAGNVGIGTSLPTSPLHIKSATDVNVRFDDSGSSSYTWYMNDAQNIYIPNVQLASTHTFYANGQRKVDIDSSGNLLVGKTATGLANAGIEATASNILRTTKANSASAEFNRTGTDGDIAIFWKDTVPVGSIGTQSGSPYIGGTNRGIRFDSTQIIPVDMTAAGSNADNSIDIGNSGVRFKDLYLSGSANVGSLSAQGGAGDAYLQVGSNTGSWTFKNYQSSHALTLEDSDGTGEVLRVDTSGNLLVGTSNSSQSVGIGTKIQEWGSVMVVNNSSTGGGDAFSYYSTASSNYKFWVNANGQIAAISTSIQSLSDQRFKENIRDLDDGLSKVMQLKPRKFDWKEGKGSDIKDARGFIAQEFEEVFPDLIGEWKDPAPEGEEPYKSVSQDLIPTLVKAIQEQQTLIESLTARVAALEE